MYIEFHKYKACSNAGGKLCPESYKVENMQSILRLQCSPLKVKDGPLVIEDRRLNLY